MRVALNPAPGKPVGTLHGKSCIALTAHAKCETIATFTTIFTGNSTQVSHREGSLCLHVKVRAVRARAA